MQDVLFEIENLKSSVGELEDAIWKLKKSKAKIAMRDVKKSVHKINKYLK